MTKSLPKILAVFAMVALLAFAFTHSCYRTFTPYKYKLTVNIEYNGVLCSGSTVVRSVPHGVGSIDGRGGGENIKGQAAIIRLDGPKVVFVTLRRPEQYKTMPIVILPKAYGIRINSYWDAQGFKNFARQRGKRAISLDQLPPMVTFSDLNDPRSIIYLDPNDLQSALGGHARIVSATLEIVDEPISTGITKFLPWLLHFNQSYKVSPLCKADQCIDSEDLAQGVR